MTMTARADLTGGRPVVPSRGVLRPLGLREVQILDGFWAKRQEIISSATLSHAQDWMGRLGWIGNFAKDVGQRSAERRGREFSDSEVYKLVEAMSWEVGRSGDRDLDAQIAELTTLIGGAQAPDGYLHTAFGGIGQRPRYSDLAWGHELYCTGHLLQAAVARARTSGTEDLLTIARRAADHVCDTFGPAGAKVICGHPEIEPALVELARVTGEQRYLDQAALFVERRGHRTLPAHQFGWSYFSDDIPVRQARVLRGHAVRALYLASGVVDVAVENGDDELLAAVIAQFDRTLARRTYITGGMGSRHTDESFGEDFVLPADRAYSETCAAVAAVMLAWRLLLATGQDRYADVIERVLFNVVATSLGDDGRSFFYANPLHQRAPAPPPAADAERLDFGGGLRAPWFEVSCCLPNLSRLLASLAGYLASVDDAGLRVHQYADADITTRLADGRPVGVRMRTAYPDAGTVRLAVTESPGGAWTLGLRRPSWAPDATVTVNGERVSGDPTNLTRDFAVGDVIELDLPIAPRFTRPDPRIDAVRGCVAVEQGPLVLCVESPGGALDLDALRIDAGTAPVGARPVTVHGHTEELPDAPWPYQDAGPVGERTSLRVPAIPYHQWGRRGPATMRIWLPTA